MHILGNVMLILGILFGILIVLVIGGGGHPRATVYIVAMALLRAGSLRSSW